MSRPWKRELNDRQAFSRQMNKCIVLLSGGLDSRIAVKLMQQKKFEVTAVHFKLPFSKDYSGDVIDFCKKEKIKLVIFDCTKGRLLKEYLKVIKNPKYKRGAGFNPCIDCKIFLYKKTKKLADKKKINTIVTGEVQGQRPMSQTKNAIKIIEKEAGLTNQIIRPLSEIGITGRRREKQINLAKKFKINYPSPAGGCMLCEKNLKNRFKFLINRGLNEKEVELAKIGRHFVIDSLLVILGRNSNENKLIEKIGNKENLIIPDFPGPSAIILDITKKNTKKLKNETKQKIEEIIKIFSKKNNIKERKKFDKYKL